jgi:hypothetical protein
MKNKWAVASACVGPINLDRSTKFSRVATCFRLHLPIAALRKQDVLKDLRSNSLTAAYMDLERARLWSK